LQAWEERLRVQAERLEREREGHGQASQDAFALLAELEARESGLARRESELLEAQARLQVDGAGADAVVARQRELDERDAALAARHAEVEARALALERDRRENGKNGNVDELREELTRRATETESLEQLVAERRERLE